MIFIMNVRWAITVAAAAIATEPRRAATRVDHEDFCRRVAAFALEKSVRGTSRQIEWSVERFVGIDSHNLRGGRLASHRMLHPPLEPRLTGSLAAAYSGESG